MTIPRNSCKPSNAVVNPSATAATGSPCARRSGPRSSPHDIRLAPACRPARRRRDERLHEFPFPIGQIAWIAPFARRMLLARCLGPRSSRPATCLKVRIIGEFSRILRTFRSALIEPHRSYVKSRPPENISRHFSSEAFPDPVFNVSVMTLAALSQHT